MREIAGCLWMDMDELIHFDYRLVMRLTPPEPGTPEHQAKARHFCAVQSQRMLHLLNDRCG